MNDGEIKKQLQYNVVKSNTLIQKTRYDLTVQEQKIVLRLIQMVEPNDDCFKMHEFKMQDFCDILGIDGLNGGNYNYIKRVLLSIYNKGFWITLPNGDETTAKWIEQATISPKDGTLKIKLDDNLYPYLLDLKKYFTSYSLYYIIAMEGKYSIRLYELLKSFANLGKAEYGLEEIERCLFCIFEKEGQTVTKYNRWVDFKRNVIEPAIDEINELSDLNVSYKTLNEGKRVVGVEFKIKFKADIDERVEAWKNIDAKFNEKKINKILNDKIKSIAAKEQTSD